MAEDKEGDGRENTVEWILGDLASVHDRITLLDQALGAQRFDRFARRLRTLDIHADPAKTAFNHMVAEDKNKHFIWLQLASCGDELKAAWNQIRLAHLSGARRSGRVALEHLAAGVLEGLPTPLIGAQWPDLPKKKLPIWEMSMPRDYRTGGSQPPYIEASTFAHILLKVPPTLPGWTTEKATKLREYLSTYLHPFAHGSAQGISYLVAQTTTENPVVGSSYHESCIPLYTAMADELIGMAELFGDILYAAHQYLGRHRQ